jgi:subtilisin family serine protease
MHPKRIRWGTIVRPSFFMMAALLWGGAGSAFLTGKAAADLPSPPAFVPNRVLVSFRPAAPLAARANTVVRCGLRPNACSTNPHFAALDITPQAQAAGATVASTIAALRADPTVAVVEPDYYLYPAGVPNDPRFGEMYGLQNTGQNGGTPGADIGAVKAWDIVAGNDTIVVAVIDTGVDYNHEDLRDNILRDAAGNVVGFDFFDNDADPMDFDDHGTHCAGTIGARGNNGIGTVGVCHRVKIMPLRFIGPNPIPGLPPVGPISAAINCIDFAIQRGARVMSNSWGTLSFSQMLLDAVLRARSAGILFVAAAGNGGLDGIGDDNDAVPVFPANFRLSADNVVAVAATDNRDQLGGFSNFGRNSVDLGAPGVGVLSTTRNNTYKFFNGTSMATPHTAGVATLILCLNPTLSYLELKNRLYRAAVPIPALAGKTVTGARLSLNRALESLKLTSPVAGQFFKVGKDIQIRWNSEGFAQPHFVKLELSRDGGFSYAVIHPNTPDDGEYTWTSTLPLSSLCRIRITSADGQFSDETGTFAIVDGALTVLEPAADKLAIIGRPLAITWNSDGFVGAIPTVQIELIRGGVPDVILSNVANHAGLNSVLWPLTGGPTDQAQIRITPTNGADFADAGDVFRISEPFTLKLLSPNGGDKLVSGTPVEVRWDSTGEIDTVRIDFSKNNRDWETLVGSAPNLGSATAVLPAVVTRGARMRVVSLTPEPDGGDIQDASDTPFEVQVPGFRITSPKSGKTFIIGLTETVTWTSTGLETDALVKLELNSGTGIWTQISPPGGVPNSGAFGWTVNGAATANAFLRVSLVDFPSVQGVSPRFILAAASIRVVKANGGESLPIGDQTFIKWTGSVLGIGTVDIQLARAGSQFETIITGAENTGSAPWGITGPESSAARFRVIWNPPTPLGPVQDDSNSTFRIVSGSTVSPPSSDAEESRRRRRRRR